MLSQGLDDTAVIHCGVGAGASVFHMFDLIF
jgi:hypothetical protein